MTWCNTKWWLMMKQFQLKNKMMDVVKHCETSKTSLTVKVQPTPQTQLQWLEISVWSVTRGVTLHVHSPPAEPWPRATFVLYLTARGRQCGTGDSVRSHPLSRTLAVVSGLQHQRGGTRNQLHVDTSLRTPHLSAVDTWSTTRWPRPCQLWRILRQGTL